MTISKVKHWPHKASFLKPDASGVVAFADPATPYAHDFLVTLLDEADATRDGFCNQRQQNQNWQSSGTRGIQI